MLVLRMEFSPCVHERLRVFDTFWRIEYSSERSRLCFCVPWSFVPIGFGVFQICRCRQNKERDTQLVKTEVPFSVGATFRSPPHMTGFFASRERMYVSKCVFHSFLASKVWCRTWCAQSLQTRQLGSERTFKAVPALTTYVPTTYRFSNSSVTIRPLTVSGSG